jgi:hypothetical protein
MNVEDLLTIAGMVGLIAFIIFAFVQGMRVRPSRNSQRDTIFGATDAALTSGGHWSDPGGHH